MMSREPLNVAYIMSRFPKLTETFVLYEMEQLKALGFRVIVMPLRLEKERVQHPEIEHIRNQIAAAPLCDLRTLAVNLKWLVSRPRRYLGTFLRVVRETATSPKFLAGAIVYFPKVVKFADTATREGVRHIHAHFASHPAMAAWCIHQLCDIPYSFTAHGTDLHVDQCMLATKARDAAFAVTVSHYNKAFVAQQCGARASEPFIVIRTGTDPEKFKPLPSRRATPPSGPLRVLCVAAYREVKGHDVLIRACAKLRDRGVPCHCTLVGYGPREKHIRELIKALAMERHITLAGPQPQPAVIQLLQTSDVIALTSIQTKRGSREGIPVALMEGMACGLPVVASRISGIPELVEEERSGLLFTPGDAEEAAAALGRLAADPVLRETMGAAGRDCVVKAFDLSHNAALLANCIRKHIADHT